MPSSPTANTDLVNDLIGAFGADCVFVDADIIAPRLVEWRKLYTGHADVLVRPKDTNGVARTLALASHHRVAVTPQGGRTGLVGGGVPQGGLILSLDRLTRLDPIDVMGGTVTVGAGVTLKTVQSVAENAGFLFPLSLASEGSCSIGGTLATNAGGTAVLRYGMMRDLCLGLEIVLPDGRIVESLTALRKDNAGYDLKQIFIGAEGTLGVITAAVLKLFPQPRATATALCGAKTPSAILDLFYRLRQSFGEALTTFEIMPRFGIAAVTTHMGVADPLADSHPWYALIELSSTRADATGFD